MLIEFRVENHRSIRDEQALTMRAGRQDDSADPRPRRIQGCSDPLLPAAALYGANASGKSNVLSALGFMRNAVLQSHRAWPPDGGVPRDPFAWGEKATQPSLFEVSLVVSGIRYQYGFVADGEQFLEEWLFAWPGKRKQIWFVRELGKYKFSEHLHGENRLIEQMTRPNALFLSAAVQLRHEQLAALYSWFRHLNAVNVPGRRPSALRFAGHQLLPRWMEAWLGQNPQHSLFEEDFVPFNRLSTQEGRKHRARLFAGTLRRDSVSRRPSQGCGTISRWAAVVISGNADRLVGLPEGAQERSKATGGRQRD